MEPLFFKAENKQRFGKRMNGASASMEPLFFKAENKKDKKDRLEAHVGFNGAAFFQSGKWVIFSTLLQALSRRFNGAAFFQSGK